MGLEMADLETIIVIGVMFIAVRGRQNGRIKESSGEDGSWQARAMEKMGSASCGPM